MASGVSPPSLLLRTTRTIERERRKERIKETAVCAPFVCVCARVVKRRPGSCGDRDVGAPNGFDTADAYAGRVCTDRATYDWDLPTPSRLDSFFFFFLSLSFSSFPQKHADPHYAVAGRDIFRKQSLFVISFFSLALLSLFFFAAISAVNLTSLAKYIYYAGSL